MYRKSNRWAIVVLLAAMLMGSAPAIFACGEAGEGDGVVRPAVGEEGVFDPRNNQFGCSVDPQG